MSDDTNTWSAAASRVRRNGTAVWDQDGRASPPLTEGAPQGLGARRARPVLRGEGRRTVTAAERRVAGLLAEGHTPLQIAAHLGVSIYTVRAHLRALFRKYGVNRQVALVRLLLMRGLLACWTLRLGELLEWAG